MTSSKVHNAFPKISVNRVTALQMISTTLDAMSDMERNLIDVTLTLTWISESPWRELCRLCHLSIGMGTDKA